MGRSSKKTFRDGSYYRHVVVGKRTVKEGECCAVWDSAGARKVYEGPHRVRLWFAHVRFLDRHVADADEYLVVQFRDGSKAHHRGPISLFFDPCVHERVVKHQTFKLAANEAIVVYRESADPQQALEPEGVRLDEHAGDKALKGKGKRPSVAAAATSPLEGAPKPQVVASSLGKVERRVIKGPCVFIPDAFEWVHTFSWHGSIGSNGKGSKTGTMGDEKVPHALSFQKLRCMPDQMYVSVRDVRTSDDAQLTVHLMLFYELVSIDKMLDNSNDPIGDFVNAAAADVMTFGASSTYERLMERTSDLSLVDTFPILGSRMQQTGYTLLRVIYRGFSTSVQLQAMHDEAIAKRTKLRFNSDSAEVEQAQVAMELRCKQERSEREQQLNEAATRHKVALVALEAEQARKDRDADHEQALRHAAARAEQEIKLKVAANDEEARRLSALKTLGVELTKLMCTAAQPLPDKHVRVDSTLSPAVHLELK